MTTEASVWGSRRFGLGSLSMRRRIVGSVALLSLLGLLGAGAVGLVVERQRIEVRVERLLSQEVAEFRELARGGIDPETGRSFSTANRLIEVSMLRNVPDEHEIHLGFLPDVTIAPVDGEGALHRDPQFRRAVTRHAKPAFGEFESNGTGTVTFAVLPFVMEGKTSYYVAAYFVDREMAELGDTIRSYTVAAAVAWTALVLAAWGLAGRILRPIHELRATAARISDSDLSRRIDVRGDDELSALGWTFNGMLDRLQEALGAQRRMLDDAGHELRTPITVIRGHLELMDADDRKDVEGTRLLALEELDRMGGLVEDLLVLAKARRPDFLAPEPTDVGDLVRRTVEKAQGLGPRTWVVDAASSVIAVLDPQRITQAMLQLASNAVAVTHEGDPVGMGCSPTPRGVQIWVRDTGPGVPPAERLRIFDRWQSGSQHPMSGQGTGLGLAIVAAIAKAHRGTARVTSATAAGGAMFVIELPLGDLAEEERDAGDDAGHADGERPDTGEQTAYDSIDSLFDNATGRSR